MKKNPKQTRRDQTHGRGREIGGQGKGVQEGEAGTGSRAWRQVHWALGGEHTVLCTDVRL